jgi:hypothetical protein
MNTSERSHIVRTEGEDSMDQVKKTTNRKLEGFLYALGIKPIQHEVLWDGMVQWTYENNQSFINACELYRQTKVRLYKESH